MNIKALGSHILSPVEQKTRPEGAREVKPQESTERDADGRQQGSEQEAKRDLSDQEILEAMDKIKALPGVKNHNLRVRLVIEDDIKIVLIEDPEGRVVRRLSEAQLWASVQHLDKTTGQIFHKAM